MAGSAGDARPLEAKVLTVSDGVVAGTREDRSGEALEAYLSEAGWQVVERAAVADGADTVAGELRRLSAGFHGLIVTTGGTGFGPRDATPEGTREVLEREAPGLAEAMRLVNPLGRLSRGAAGTIGTSLVLNAPGSSKGCVETVGAVIDVVGHAVRLLVDNYDPHPNGEPHPHGDPHSHSEPHTHGEPHSHSEPHTHGEPHSHGEPHTHGGRDAHG